MRDWRIAATALLVWLVPFATNAQPAPSRAHDPKPAPTTTAPTTAPPAQADAAARAAELKKKGDEAMDSLRYLDALEAYAQAEALAPSMVLVYNRGRALQALGDFPAALDLFERFAAEAPPIIKSQVTGLDELLAEVRGKVTTLTITCDSAGAQVRLRDKLLGVTPLPRAVRVAAGHAVLEATQESSFPVRREVDLPGGGLAQIDLHLASKQVSGILHVASAVMASDVAVDEKPLGKVPLETIVNAGVHKVKISHDGYRPLDTDVVVAAGEEKTLNVPLEKEPPIVAKWWFWTAVGVVVVGGTVTAIAATSSRSPDKGTIAPGTASTPLVTW